MPPKLPEDANIIKYCTAHEGFAMTWFDSHGDCVSTLQSLWNNGNADAVGICKAYDNFWGMYETQGECVIAVRDWRAED